MGVFDIVGPIMVGPSSSHTAGAARLGHLARKLLHDEPTEAVLTFYGSFAKTYRGHGTDRACVAGLLGWAPDDLRLREALELAPTLGLSVQIVASEEDVGHPNTVRFQLRGRNGTVSEMVGISIGGGRIRMVELDGYAVDLDGINHTLVTIHRDKPGIVAYVSRLLADRGINISAMRVFRKERNQLAMMFIETDTAVPDSVLKMVAVHPAIDQVREMAPV